MFDREVADARKAKPHRDSHKNDTEEGKCPEFDGPERDVSEKREWRSGSFPEDIENRPTNDACSKEIRGPPTEATA